MNLNELTAVSPIDGRYRKQITALAPYFSEFGLIKYRIKVEIEYLIHLIELPLPQLKNFPSSKIAQLRDIYLHFSEQDAGIVKELEKKANHDVKAVEYFIKSKLTDLQLDEYLEFVHFALTSQDINNTSVPLLIKDALEQVILPQLHAVNTILEAHANEWQQIPMLAKTHGQPASPTKLGKELMVFCERLKNQIELLKTIPYSAKFGGATGNFNAHFVAYPQINWQQFANQFCQALGLKRSQFTTQIEHYDNLAALFDNIKRINTILIDLDRDFWQYISMDYFKQKINKEETGSSAMPHKVNPIDFENSEGNLGFANAILEHLSAKLPISRLQRDLTDSTVLRNVGVPMAHTLIGLKSLEKGFAKLLLNTDAINHDLEQNWAVVAEGIQTILRREGYPKPYEALKELTRDNVKITAQTIAAFIDTLAIDEQVKIELRKITPYNYVGINFSFS
jgi:adenylosuccinate lyase